MSSFFAKKLDMTSTIPDTWDMGGSRRPPPQRKIAAAIRQRIERRADRLWRLEDFRDFPFGAAAQTLSRLAADGVIERVSKGLYYRARETALGKSRPNPASIQKLASARKAVFPSGIAAANLLGFTTQTARRSEISTSALSVPRKLVGSDAIVHVRRPEAWARLSSHEAAILDFLRRGGRTGELSSELTIKKTLELLAEKGCFERLLKVADTEPPRVRALLGALGELLRKKDASLKRLRVSLNPYSKFDFGMFAGLPNARSWQCEANRS